MWVAALTVHDKVTKDVYSRLYKGKAGSWCTTQGSRPYCRYMLLGQSDNGYLSAATLEQHASIETCYASVSKTCQALYSVLC